MRKGRFSALGLASAEAKAPRPDVATWPAALAGPAFVAAAALVAPQPGWIVAAAVGGIGLGLYPAWRRRASSTSGGAGPARSERWLAHVEESGAGWFWETNADGRLAAVSASLARALERDPDALTGRPFEELLLVEVQSEAEQQPPTLGFHLASRFPFADILVSPNGRRDLCWAISGQPRFDEVGRYLGFQGFALALRDERRAEIRSRQLAARDSLTGLPNRARMRALLDEALANSDSRREGTGLFLIDLDRFKQVNDTLGHPVGDLLLQEVARRAAAALGGDGQVGRLGGDEFEALLPGVDEEGRLAATAERLIAALSAPYVLRGHRVAIGASIGIAISRPGRTLSDALIKEADLALYAAKKAGRGTYRFYEAHMQAEEMQRQILENDLRQAVSRGELRLVFQPVVGAASEEPIGFEALLRWAHPVRGLLGPSDFLAIAEAAGLIGVIGEWVLRAACAEAARWPQHLRLAVNLSVAELEGTQLAATIAGALAASGLEADRLELDLTEAALLSEDPALRSRLASLRALGVRLALDDFGAGSASLLSLQSTELHRVKIHPGLLRAAAAARGEAVLASLVGLAETLAIELTAEGVETAEDLAAVRRLGIGSVQGFLLARPAGPAETAALAAASRPIVAGADLQPRPPRHGLIRQASLGWSEGQLPVRLRNISAAGAMVEAGRDLATGLSVELDLSATVRLAGQVRWSQEGRIGISFAEAFDLRRLGRMRRPAAATSLRPDYLDSELAPDSPWAGRTQRLSAKDVGHG